MPWQTREAGVRCARIPGRGVNPASAKRLNRRSLLWSDAAEAAKLPEELRGLHLMGTQKAFRVGRWRPQRHEEGPLLASQRQDGRRMVRRGCAICPQRFAPESSPLTPQSIWESSSGSHSHRWSPAPYPRSAPRQHPDNKDPARPSPHAPVVRYRRPG
jgi:hypothetical protein